MRKILIGFFLSLAFSHAFADVPAASPDGLYFWRCNENSNTHLLGATFVSTRTLVKQELSHALAREFNQGQAFTFEPAGVDYRRIYRGREDWNLLLADGSQESISIQWLHYNGTAVVGNTISGLLYCVAILAPVSSDVRFHSERELLSWIFAALAVVVFSLGFIGGQQR